MSWRRIDAQATTYEPHPPEELINLCTGPPVLVIDCRKILRIGLFPGAIVLRRKRKEATLEQALDRLIEEMMFDAPPEDQTRAFLLSQVEAGEGDDADEVAATAAYLRSNFGCERICTVAGGCAAIEASAARILLGMPIERARGLPSQLSESMHFGSTHSALDARLLSTLGITHVVSLLRRQLILGHVAAGQHLVLNAGGLSREQGNEGLRALLDEALPFILAAAETTGQKILIHCETGNGGAAAAIACAAIVADGGSNLTLEEAAARLRACRPRSALHQAAMAQLRECEAWLRNGAPPDGTGPSPEVEALSSLELVDEAVEEAKASKMFAVRQGIPLDPPTFGDEFPAATPHDSELANAAARMQAELIARLPAVMDGDNDDDDDDDMLGDGDFAG